MKWLMLAVVLGLIGLMGEWIWGSGSVVLDRPSATLMDHPYTAYNGSYTPIPDTRMLTTE